MTTTSQTKPRGGEGKHHARNVPPITRAEVDAVLGPDAAELSPAERFARFVGRVISRGKGKEPESANGRLPEPPCLP